MSSTEPEQAPSATKVKRLGAASFELVAVGLRSIAASFPVAGSFATLWSECETVRNQKRIEEQIQFLREAVSKCEERLRKTKAQGETFADFPDLLERVLEYVKREQQESKRRRFAFSLIQMFTAPTKLQYDTKVSILEALDTLTETDIAWLARFAVGPERVANFTDSQVFWQDPETRAEVVGHLAASLAKLESRALIAETADRGDVFESEGRPTSWVNQWRRKTYELTSFGTLLVSISKTD
jgi:hypothetical protein